MPTDLFVSLITTSSRTNATNLLLIPTRNTGDRRCWIPVTIADIEWHGDTAASEQLSSPYRPVTLRKNKKSQRFRVRHEITVTTVRDRKTIRRTPPRLEVRSRCRALVSSTPGHQTLTQPLHNDIMRIALHSACGTVQGLNFVS
jgi:hypothetical protein